MSPTVPTTDGSTSTGRPLRRRRRLVVLASLGAVLAVVGLVVFQPWKLVVDEVVDEALPEAVATGSPTPAGPAASSGAGLPSSTPTSTTSPSTRTLATGAFISHEHGTTGSVRLLELPDGRRILRLDGLDTSNGPDLKVWVTDQAVVDGPSGWRVFDDGRYVDLGSLKGNKGNQNYVVPADARLDGLRSVSIWCDRFDVSFGAAELDPVL